LNTSSYLAVVQAVLQEQAQVALVAAALVVISQLVILLLNDLQITLYA
jgi:hypothetical protein